MRTKAIGFSSFLTLIIILFTGCFSVNLTMPVYEMKNGDEINENTIVIINDIEYRMQPEQKWGINPGDTIGYAGSWKIEVLEAKGDTKRNFICLFDTSQFWDKQYAIFHRTDLPEPSSDSVSMISYYEQDFRGEKIQRLTNTITDENTINELFKVTANGTRVFDVSNFKGVSIVLSCYSDLVPGAVYILSIAESNGKFMCGNDNEGYVEISADLMEHLAGHKIDLEQLVDK